MENRSFDHMLGWVEGADGRQRGLKLSGPTRASCTPTYRLAPDFQGCGHPDPDHSYEGGRVEYNGGACDGWLRAGDNDDYAIGYYAKKDLPFFGAAAPRWTVVRSLLLGHHGRNVRRTASISTRRRRIASPTPSS